MADNLRKFTTQEVLNKVYTDSSGITIGLNSQSSKETLNAVLDSSNNRLQVAMAGGTISGDVTIGGDLTVTGSTAITTNEVIQGTSIIDVTNTEAFLVRKNSDAGDILIVDTTNNQIEMYNQVGINTTPLKPLHIKVNNNDTDPHFFIENAHNSGRSHMRFYNSNRSTSWAIGQDSNDTFVIANSASISANESLVLDSNSRISLSNNDNNSNNTVFGKSAFNDSSNDASDKNVVMGNLAMVTVLMGEQIEMFL